jgi:hypothetical protein
MPLDARWSRILSITVGSRITLSTFISARDRNYLSFSASLTRD